MTTETESEKDGNGTDHIVTAAAVRMADRDEPDAAMTSEDWDAIPGLPNPLTRSTNSGESDVEGTLSFVRRNR